MRRIFIESPCFGFGPISTSIALANRLSKAYEIWFITYGEALQFLRKSTKYPYLEIDTRVEIEYDKIKKATSHVDLFVVNTNVEFSTYLLQNQYKVLVVDTLYWMWNDVPDIYANYQYFINQNYFGTSVKALPTHQECKPIINYDIWTPKPREYKPIALISFGGMSEPGDNTYIVSSAKAMIKCIVEVLPYDITDVYVVGGLFNNLEEFIDTSRIHVLGSIDAKAFNILARESRYVFLSPGLTSLYEMIYSKIPFCLLPGLNVSQIFQVRDFNLTYRYPFCIQWPKAKELTELFSSVAELEGIQYLRDYISTINIEIDIGIQKAVIEYVDAVDKDNINFDNDVFTKLFSYPSIEDIASNFLKEIVNE